MSAIGATANPEQVEASSQPRKRRWLWLSILVVFILGICLATYNSSKPPYEFISKYHGVRLHSTERMPPLSWLTSPASVNYVFDCNPEALRLEVSRELSGPGWVEYATEVAKDGDSWGVRQFEDGTHMRYGRGSGSIVYLHRMVSILRPKDLSSFSGSTTCIVSVWSEPNWFERLWTRLKVTFRRKSA